MSYVSDDLKVLEGRTVTALRLSAAGEAVRFETSEGPLGFFCSGDCCSESWINHVSGIDALLGQVITGIVEHEEEVLADDPDSRQGVDKIYGITLETAKGRCDLELRNSSNGYYGGTIDRDDDYAGAYERDVREDF